MKALYIPTAILVSLLAGSLWTSAYVQNRTESWITTAEELSASLEEQHWHEMESGILSLHKDWAKSQKYFHLFLIHQNLDEAEKYFSGALAACREKDAVELRIHLAQLSSQFSYLGSTQSITIQNIL